ncbi:hypothetical protein VJJ19_07525, partial [Parvimonas sp. D4]
FFKKLLRYIFGAAGFLMTAHAEGHTFNEIGLLVPDTIITYTPNGIVDFQDIVSVYTNTFYAITPCLVYEVFTAVLFINGGT